MYIFIGYGHFLRIQIWLTYLGWTSGHHRWPDPWECAKSAGPVPATATRNAWPNGPKICISADTYAIFILFHIDHIGLIYG